MPGYKQIEPKWKKGESGNPKGRPPMPDLKEALTKLLSEQQNGTTALEAILKALFKRALSGDVRAAQELLDRGFGKSQQLIDVTTQGEQINHFTYEVIKSDKPTD